MNITSHQEDIFSVATLLYTRLRKVTSRVIDVAYLMQDRTYAHHVITIALQTRDDQLADYVERLRLALDLPHEGFQSEIQRDAKKAAPAAKEEEEHVSFSLF